MVTGAYAQDVPPGVQATPHPLESWHNVVDCGNVVARNFDRSNLRQLNPTRQHYVSLQDVFTCTA